MILQFPFLQFGLHLVQHHGQLSQNLLQVVHVVVVQDFCLKINDKSRVQVQQLNCDLLLVVSLVLIRPQNSNEAGPWM